jgi:hypothetical protein
MGQRGECYTHFTVQAFHRNRFSITPTAFAALFPGAAPPFDVPLRLVVDGHAWGAPVAGCISGAHPKAATAGRVGGAVP